MVKFLDNREREQEILDLIVNSYIEESKPISSRYICGKYNLACSSATIRNVMVSLEKKGLLSHIHTSSGRVPTQDGFKQYVQRLKEEDFHDYSAQIEGYLQRVCGATQVINNIVDILAEISGYTSMFAVYGRNEKLFFKGMRFILEQPEFEDIKRVKDLFFAFETKMYEFQEILFRYLNNRVSILIGDDIGVEEISECALIISGLKKESVGCVFGLLGPVRMNYVKAASCLSTIARQFEEVMEELL